MSEMVWIVTKRIGGVWFYWTGKGWDTDKARAKSWPKSHLHNADKVSMTQLGAIVVPHAKEKVDG